MDTEALKTAVNSACSPLQEKPGREQKALGCAKEQVRVWIKPSPTATPLEEEQESCVESGQLMEEINHSGNERTILDAPADPFLSWAPMTSSTTHLLLKPACLIIHHSS